MGSLVEPLIAGERHGGRARQYCATCASYVSRCSPQILFSWVPSALGTNGLMIGDAMRLPGGMAAADLRLRQQMANHPSASLLECIAHVFCADMARAAACKLAADVLRYLPPLLLSRFLSCLDESGNAEPYALAIALPLVMLVQALLVNQYFWHALRLGVVLRGALTAAVCRRALLYRRRDGADSGKLSNLISSDCGRLNTACGTLNMAWSAPLQLLLALGMLWRALGHSVLGGVMMLLLLWPVQIWLSRALSRQRVRTARATDERLRRTEAALGAIRAVKLEGLEGLCISEILAARAVERAAMQREALIRAANVLFVTIAPTLVSLASFTMLAASGEPLHASTVFASLALFNLLRSPLSALPDLFTAVAHARVALRRLEHVLQERDAAAHDLGGLMGAPTTGAGGTAASGGGYIPPILPDPSAALKSSVASADAIRSCRPTGHGTPPNLVLDHARFSWDEGTVQCAPPLSHEGGGGGPRRAPHASTSDALVALMPAKDVACRLVR